VMEDERKHVLLAGVYLGDIALAQAGFAGELPAYVKGLDYAGLVPDDEDGRRIRAQVEDLLPESTGGGLPESITRLVLTQAVDKGKFLSAIRCLELLGERDETVDNYLADVPRLLAEGQRAKAAEALVIASNLDNEDGMPLFQTTGADLHAASCACKSNLDFAAIIAKAEHLLA